MKYKASEVLQFVAENDVKFIRLAFCDIFGTQKNISILPEKLEEAFTSGIPFDGSAIRGFQNLEHSDLFLFPDPSTLSVLPWRPSQGRVARLYCDIRYPDGRIFEGDCRHILRGAVERAESMGYTCQVGTECEFYLFKQNEYGEPTKTPHDIGGYMDVAPADKGENIRREICLTLEEMGISPETSHHEQGPGQNEIDFRCSGALEAADNLITFKTVVKTAAAGNGLYASFMPKPLAGHSGNGLHVNLSLLRSGRNIFDKESGNAAEADSFIAGLLARICEITAFLNPLTNSYLRLGGGKAPKYVTWSRQNRSQLIRIPAASGAQSRIELRSPDPACNPYLAFALLLHAGLDGIEQGLSLQPETDRNLYELSDEEAASYTALPESLDDALSLAQNSSYVAAHVPEVLLEKYAEQKQSELARVAGKDRQKAEHALYFHRI